MSHHQNYCGNWSTLSECAVVIFSPMGGNDQSKKKSAPSAPAASPVDVEELERAWSEVDGGPLPKVVTAVVVGCGNRGQNYAAFALDFPKRMKVVAVAEPLEHRRRKLREQHGLPEEMAFADWKDLADRDKLADCAIVTTQDRMHLEPAVSLAKKGYHLLLEKPMSSEEEECDRMAAVFEETGVIVAVCHVLRWVS